MKKREFSLDLVTDMLKQGPIYTAKEASERTAQQIIQNGDLYLKAALAKSSFTTTDQIRELLRENNPIISEVIAKNDTTPDEILVKLTHDEEHRYDIALANNRNLPEACAQKLWKVNVDAWLNTSAEEKDYGFDDAVNAMDALETLARLQAKKIRKVTPYRHSELFSVRAVNEIVETIYTLIRYNALNEEALITIAKNNLLADASFYIKELVFTSISAKTVIENIGNWDGLISYLEIAYAEDNDMLKNLLIQGKVFTEDELRSLPEDMLYKVMNWTWMI